MKKVSLLRVVLASPGDVKAEREAVARAVEELNHGVAAARALRLELIRWETDAYPDFHPDGPQGLIDSVLRIDDCDLLIGIFWKRFGTPVRDAQSGTEHEILAAYEAWKSRRRPHLMVYFNQKPYAPQSADEMEQWRKVLEFRQRFPKEGLWWTYKGKADFERLVRSHLTSIISSYGADDLEASAPRRRKPAGEADEPNVVVGGTRNITVIGEASNNTFITGDQDGRKK
jgi:hypothetical protein